MPYAAPRVCACGRVVPTGVTCVCRRISKAEADRRRPTARQRGYDSRWDRERAAFLQLNPSCRFCCAPATVVHHNVPHRGNQKIFWDKRNWIPACKRCHDSQCQSEEKKRDHAR